MPIVLDPSKQFVEISLFYVEENHINKDTVYHFISSREDMEEWKAKGYRHENEIRDLKSKDNPLPGVPIKDQSFDSKKVIYSIRTKWKRLSWKDQNVIYSKCFKLVTAPDGTTKPEWDGLSFRDLKIKQCLREWDIKDGNNNPVPVSPETIDTLPPFVVSELINAFERYTEANAEDLGESKG